MALLTSEVVRLKYELGVNLLGVGAEPYVGFLALFDEVVQPYLLTGASTTSTTAVSAATTPTPSTLTLVDATGFAAGDTVVVDVDSRQEIATVQSVAGSVLTVLLSKLHSGTYPVTVEGGESIVRELLAQLRRVSASQASAGIVAAGVERVDEVKFATGGTSGNRRSDALRVERMRLRDELAGAIGYFNLWRRKARGGTSIGL